jgi:predicted outer membrane protein
MSGEKLVGASRQKRWRYAMLFKKRAVVFMPFFFAAVALVGNSVEVSGAEDKPSLARALSALHAASQTAIKVSDLADKRAKSDLVKAYARTVSSGNAQLNAKLMLIAQKQGIKVLPLDPKTEAGKSLSDRLKAETVMLGSLTGDAFDKEYMILVTSTQQSIIHLADARIAAATDAEVKAFFTDLKTLVEGRLTTAQDILAKVYGDDI